ncbi:hypothetical protein KB20921_19500 [Edwardsiella ictaluri]|nr:hypothetical protein KH20906_19270 [Edwardsiella ictaluri]BEI02689.1 hypothetical protein KB20921_19500 [Edwardsiella ictaluri]BEI06156.1 hypothetical protein KH201010_19420 [Edwardsiella ictaluri]BEI09613.1 hypothetical protein STU22726_19440 [Edwardsiella ictaluri]BEI13091.1 hypothetical protein STU22816_19440 [Edwardsiella ictaluri]
MLVEQALAVFVSSVDLKNLFCQIDADSLNTHDGRSAQVVTIYRPTVAQDVGGDHSINKALALLNPLGFEGIFFTVMRRTQFTLSAVAQQRFG